MGIEIYMEWEGMTEAERKRQITGFCVTKGHVGYLREAYHGGPYATRALVPEAFADGAAIIPASVLRDRLPEVLALAEERERKVYGGTDPKKMRPIVQAFARFVRLAERMERKTGHPVTITASY